MSVLKLSGIQSIFWFNKELYKREVYQLYVYAYLIYKDIFNLIQDIFFLKVNKIDIPYL